MTPATAPPRTPLPDLTRVSRGQSPRGHRLRALQDLLEAERGHPEGNGGPPGDAEREVVESPRETVEIDWDISRREARAELDRAGLLTARHDEIDQLDPWGEHEGREISSREFARDRTGSIVVGGLLRQVPEEWRVVAWRNAIYRHSDLPALARHVLAVLASRMQPDGSRAYPSRRRIGREAGVTPKTAAKYLGIAKDRNWLRVVRCRRADGAPQSSLYVPGVPESAGIRWRPPKRGRKCGSWEAGE